MYDRHERTTTADDAQPTTETSDALVDRDAPLSAGWREVYAAVHADDSLDRDRRSNR